MATEAYKRIHQGNQIKRKCSTALLTYMSNTISFSMPSVRFHNTVKQIQATNSLMQMSELNIPQLYAWETKLQTDCKRSVQAIVMGLASKL